MPERSTLRGAVISFQVLSARLTGFCASRATNWPWPGSALTLSSVTETLPRLRVKRGRPVTSTNIAKILNMYPRKGAVMVGADADLVVWDPRKEKTISAKSQQSIIDYNVFEGFKVKGLPRYTLTRGKVAVNDGKVQAEQGHGQFVAREPNNPVNRALSTWKELTAPHKIERAGIPATGV